MEKAIDIFKGLNPEQKEAVESIYGPVLVSAGPGAGKTAVLTRRAQYMILQGIDPSSILLTTFTNKAAGEIKEIPHEVKNRRQNKLEMVKNSK